ncbi:MAG: hypothetical protein COZ34_00865 [Candidatus Pacebacteria bacterium CG_4_10_14_3_um_filter_34_15]|nr:hypothetical protein [Candidatus Pacearchaeota archaeon]NCQ65213.1 hypothetical protein [Candidatus Paceibacterota bacterium]OIO45059.1 MAG: hypothetical protein AUJ41_01340 [Candidatus Pacebacteria bacterium CG1_02_43_31]PIQ80993.1 MAG: hypothetical protein COV78_02220 [Candidatus Pacebacteria bacterium CG11_big_fil_rev_8_21_14_0_20_34_55]PIX81810.1 MAG: hypothetical protein COZ34_00865 [Candidatus Pacebacteria bacterium CG_4_10_14_3_um_filter_34_15]PJC44026.1 MAG: hypothetical protein CO0
MKKSFLITILFEVALLVSIPQVFALELKVLQDGSINFYEDSVLGNEKSEGEDDDIDEDEIENETEQGDLIRTTNLNGGKIRVELEDDEIKIDIEKKSGSNQLETSKVSRLNMEIPFGKTKAQQGMAEKNKTDVKEAREEYKAYLEQLREERKTRLQEQLELRNKQREDGKQEMELESRGITARLTRAEFVYDATTGIVTLTTPSGNVHELNHFPDQAILRMEEVTTDDLENADIEVSTTDDGSIIYKSKGTKKTKFLGLFSRDVDTEIVLDDETGEVVETDLQAASLLGRILDSLSF